MKKLNSLLVGGLALVLAISLVAGACAKAVPEGAAEEEIAALESKLAAEKAKVGDLEAEITALRKPVEVLEWEPATYGSAGVMWDGLGYMAECITDMSDGRIIVTPSAAGAICPVEEQLDAVAMGVTEMMSICADYYKAKIPIFAYNDCCFWVAKTPAEVRYIYDVYEGGRIEELFREECAKYGDVYNLGSYPHIGECILFSTVPLYGIDDMKGVTFRSSGIIAEAMKLLGAGTTWFPGPEIYTCLATGVVDACVYSDPCTNIASSFHEVTKYWVKKPLMAAVACNMVIINGTVWQALPDDLKAIVEGALVATTGNTILTQEIEIAEAWKFVEDYGIEIIEWPEEDGRVWLETIRSLIKKEYGKDPASDEAFDIAERWALEMGY